MIFFIFSDLDGTFLNHKNYNYGNLKKYVSLLNANCKIIFNSSKTYEEILYLNRLLKVFNPFIVENGACIFFPETYFGNKKVDKKFFRHKNHLGYQLTKFNSEKIIDTFSKLRSKYKFYFYNELSTKNISSLTNLSQENAKKSKDRLFTNPVYWKDKDEKIKNFVVDIKEIDKNIQVLRGGRFLHILDNYNKGKAIKKFLELHDLNNHLFKTISLGDSENDISMLEITDYSCIIKNNKGKKLYLKKQNNKYYSKLKAPAGWQESLDFIFNMEKNYI